METEKDRKNDAAAIRGQLQAWDNALVGGDFEAMTKIFSDDFFESEGVTREFYVEMYKQMGVSYTESSRDNLSIRFYGDTAIVSGQWTSRGNTGQFGSFTSTSHMTDFWVKSEGTWKCVALVPSETRQAFAKIGQVRVGPDVPAEIVILFGVGVSAGEIAAFDERHLSKESEHPVSIASFARMGPIEEHAVVALKLGSSVERIERKFFIERLLKDPIVFRIFENIAPDEITLGE